MSDINAKLMILQSEWDDIHIMYSSITYSWFVAENTSQDGCFYDEFEGNTIEIALDRAIASLEPKEPIEWIGQKELQKIEDDLREKLYGPKKNTEIDFKQEYDCVFIEPTDEEKRKEDERNE